jgi:hypothetical protein
MSKSVEQKCEEGGCAAPIGERQRTGSSALPVEEREAPGKECERAVSMERYVERA